MQLISAVIAVLAAGSTLAVSIDTALAVREVVDLETRSLEVRDGAVELSARELIETRDLNLEARGRGGGQQTPLPRGWSVASQCSEDVGKKRVFMPNKQLLGLQRNVLDSNSPAACASLCQRNGYGFAAVRMGVECWCSAQAPLIRAKNKKDCTMLCSGDDSQTCGSPSTSQVYVNWSIAHKKLPKVATPRLANGWSVAFNCVIDPTVGESFLKKTKVFELQNNTPLACTRLCSQQGYDLAGVEYSNECMCGKNWKGTAMPTRKNEKECNQACTGDKTLTCGAGHRVQMYKHKSFKRHNLTIEWDVRSWE